jgi:hypothetical protein
MIASHTTSISLIASTARLPIATVLLKIDAFDIDMLRRAQRPQPAVANVNQLMAFGMPMVQIVP